MRHKGLCATVAAFLAAIALVTSLRASIDRGAIQGTVSDQQGAVVPGAKVVVKNVDTNVEVILTTNTAGFYLATELVPGKYSVRVSATGFSPVDIGNVIVTAGTTTSADAQLKVGATTQTVEVTAAAPLVESTPSNFTTGLTERYIQDVPLQGRDIQSLVQLIPGVTQSTGPSGTLFGFNSQFGGFPDPLHILGSGISVNGSQGGANAWYLDGSLNAVQGPENVVVNPSPDAVSEFNVVDNGLAAEWGRTSGAVVNVVLKSGANEMHGDLYEYNRNSFFNATNPFSRRDERGRPFLEPFVNWNNFGGTLGGPLQIPHVYNGRNRTFFFVSHDISFIREKKPWILTVPLPKERGGDFTGDPRFAAVCDPAKGVTNCLYDPFSTTGPDANGLFHRTPFATPMIPPDRIDPLAAFYLASYPDPNFLDPLQQGPSGCGNLCNNFLGDAGTSQTTHNISIKVDHTISQKHKLFAEWLFNPSYYTNFKYPWNGPTAQTQTGVAGSEPYRTINQIAAVGLTSTFSPTLVNEARFNFTRQNQIAELNPDSVVNNSDVLKHVQGLNFRLFPPFQVVPIVTLGDIGGFGPQPWQNGIQSVQAFTFLDNVTKILGKHTLKGGLIFRRENNAYLDDWGFGLPFGGGLTRDPVTGLGGSGLAQFLLGAPDEFSASPGGTYHAPWQTTDYWGLYIQDDYRVSPSLTLNFGLRYDVFGWFRERYNDIGNINFTGLNPKIPLPGRIDYVATPRHPDRNIFPARKDDFSPRISFSWAPFGNRKTVVRGGFGIIYSNGFSLAMGSQNGAISGPGFANYIGYNGDFTGQRPAFRLSAGAPDAGIPPLDTIKKNDEQFLGTGTGGYDRGNKDPYVEQWSLYIQRELPANMALSLGYVGTHGMHLFGDEFRNEDHIPTAVRLQLRNNIFLPVPVDPSLAPIYGCPIDPATGKALCPGNLVLRPLPQYQSVGVTVAPVGHNRYNSFQLKLEKRYAHGLNFVLAYTIQKNLATPNTGSLIGSTNTPTTLGRAVGRTSFIPGASSGGIANLFAGCLSSGCGYEDPDNQRRYVGPAPDDIPQILNFAVTYELPFGAGKRFANQAGLVNKVVGGWKLVQNWNFQSGVAMIFTSPCNGISCWPDLIGDPSRGRGSKTRQQLENQWYNPLAFAAPFGSDPGVIQAISTGFYPDGTPFNYNSDVYWRFGNIGTRPPSSRMPGFWNADFTLAKDLHFTETRYLQFRWEVFNSTNTPTLADPNTTLESPDFGKVRSTVSTPRQLQFALRLSF